MTGNCRVYIDVGIGSNLSGRVVFELFGDVGERFLENFRGLCTGSVETLIRGRNRKLSYKGCRFFSVVQGEYLRCGDHEFNNGDGGESIFGGYFDDLKSTRRHSQAGLLSMQKMKGLGYGSQFCITLGRIPQIDDENVIIGRVVAGMEYVRAIEHVPVDSKFHPKIEVGILSCGEFGVVKKVPKDKMSQQRELLGKLMDSLGRPDATESQESEDEYHVKCLYSGKEIKKKLPKQTSATTIGKNLLREALSGVSHHIPPEEQIETSNREVAILQSLHEESESSSSPLLSETDEVENETIKRLKNLSERLGECKRLNEEEISNEKSLVDLHDSAKKPKRPPEETNGKIRGIQDPAIAVERAEAMREKKQKNAKFGWNVFNQDALYRTHKKRLKETPFNAAEYQYQKSLMGDSFYESSVSQHRPTEAAKDTLVRNLEKQYKKRETFSRRRMFDDEARDVTYINRRNRVFNEKLQRSFGAHSLEIRQNLERGTAL